MEVVVAMKPERVPTPNKFRRLKGRWIPLELRATASNTNTPNIMEITFWGKYFSTAAPMNVPATLPGMIHFRLG